MIGLLILMAVLGLSAIDPIGIAAMPILLLQKHPYKRSFIFLLGSFVSLMLMGLLLAQGFGRVVLRFDNSHAWIVPYVELIAGIILLLIGCFLLWRLKKGGISLDPPESFINKLRLGNFQLFIVGAILVALLSIIDVVFIIIMIRVGQKHLSIISLILAIAIYSLGALALQFAVVFAYWLSPEDKRKYTLNNVHLLLTKYANQAIILVSFLLGFLFIVLSIKKTII